MNDPRHQLRKPMMHHKNLVILTDTRFFYSALCKRRDSEAFFLDQCCEKPYTVYRVLDQRREFMQPGIFLHATNKEADPFLQIDTLAKIGIRHTFIKLGCDGFCDILRATKEAGIVCDFLHSEQNGRFRGLDCSMRDLCVAGERGERMLEILMDNIGTCRKNDTPVLVVHAPVLPPELSKNGITAERYEKLGDFARKCGVTISFENIEHTETVEYALSIVPDSTFCWDCGHEACRRKDGPALPLLSEKLAAVHIHDNLIFDDHHLIPFEGKVDFCKVSQKLAESRFDGTLMLEVHYKTNEYNSHFHSFDDFALRAKAAAEKLIGMIENCKNS